MSEGAFEKLVTEILERLDRLEGARLGAAEHRVIHAQGNELVCSCGAYLTNYGLTRTLVSCFAEHVRRAAAGRKGES